MLMNKILKMLQKHIFCCPVSRLLYLLILSQLPTVSTLQAHATSSEKCRSHCCCGNYWACPSALYVCYVYQLFRSNSLCAITFSNCSAIWGLILCSERRVNYLSSVTGEQDIAWEQSCQSCWSGVIWCKESSEPKESVLGSADTKQTRTKLNKAKMLLIKNSHD